MTEWGLRLGVFMSEQNLILVWLGRTWRGTAGPGWVWRGKAGPGGARHGTARPGRAGDSPPGWHTPWFESTAGAPRAAAGRGWDGFAEADRTVAMCWMGIDRGAFNAAKDELFLTQAERLAEIPPAQMELPVEWFA